MFTGIIETQGLITAIKHLNSNNTYTVKSSLTPELRIDQSLSHNGVCLTVIGIGEDTYQVTAIAETLAKSTLGKLSIGSMVNLERAMKLGTRLDGHIVQGHVDQVGRCTGIKNMDGSWVFTIDYDSGSSNVTVEKGSITINGVSLTVLDSKHCEFSVAIIPYTYEHTSFNTLKVDDLVNLEFDIIGKYVARLMPQ